MHFRAINFSFDGMKKLNNQINFDKIEIIKNGGIFMNVTLISYTPEPEKIVATAAKLCYSPCSIEETKNKLTDESIKSFVKMLADIGHESPLEHITFTFGIEGVSRALLAQLTRHRMASYSVQSQRYVKNTDLKYVVPEEIKNFPEAVEEFETSIKQSYEHYNKLASILEEKHKNRLIKMGVDENTAQKAAEKLAIEDARYVLPNSCTTNIICTFNARSLLNFFSHRCCRRAQQEIRELATKMLKLVKEKAPNIFSSAGPPCVSGKCKEGKMSCGKALEIRESFKNL